MTGAFLPLITLFVILVQLPAFSQAELSPDLQRRIDSLVAGAIAKSGVPGASVAIVKDGQIASAKAYGLATVEPEVPAAPEMRYCIGSISKQFTAAAILLLQEEGKVSLDDHVVRFIPDLTRAGEVTIRQLLSHTSGYQDYWPQDYVMPAMLEPVTPEQILDRWAHIPLDFEPGTQYQYSNTNYVIAGIIAEKAAGKPLLQYLQEKIFTPLGMKSVADLDQQKATGSDPAGYRRFALGPLRPAPKEGKGWLFAAGELAMTARDLALWDISVMDRKIMSPLSYQLLGTEVLLKSGSSTRYGLGVGIGAMDGHRTLGHGGEVSGFTAQNTIFPEERAAVVVLTNQDAVPASGTIARGIAQLLLAKEDPVAARALERDRKIFEGLQLGTIDRSLFTENANSYFSDQALEDCKASLAPLGTAQEFTQTSKGLRGGMISRAYRVKCAQKSLRVWTFEMPDGKLEQYQLVEQD